MSNPTLVHFPLRSSFAGTATTGAVVATKSGPERFGADGYIAEEATTNLIPNPSAETNLTNIAAYAGTTNTRVDTHALSGSWSVESVTTGSGSGQGVQYQTPILSYTGASRTFTMSIWARGAGSVNAGIHVLYGDATTTFAATTNVALTGDWQRIIPASLTIDPAKTVSRLYVNLRTAGSEAVTFYTDAAQIEEKAYATTYCDGSLGTGYTWSGTAHASTSTRAATSLSYDIGEVPGEIALKYTESGGATTIAYFTATGAIGSYGTLDLTGNVLTITSTRPIGVMDVLAVDRELTGDEKTLLAATPEWSFTTLASGGIGASMAMSMGLRLGL